MLHARYHVHLSLQLLFELELLLRQLELIMLDTALSHIYYITFKQTLSLSFSLSPLSLPPSFFLFLYYGIRIYGSSLSHVYSSN